MFKKDAFKIYNYIMVIKLNNIKLESISILI